MPTGRRPAGRVVRAETRVGDGDGDGDGNGDGNGESPRDSEGARDSDDPLEAILIAAAYDRPMTSPRGSGCLLALIAFAAGAGCASPSIVDAGNDAASDIAADVSLATDATDTPEASFDATPLDAPSDAASADSEDAPVDGASLDDVVIDPGMCGMAVRTCLCGCGSNAACQSGCINGDVDCGACVYGAAATCCPAEDSAFAMCVDQYMCADQACVTLHCAAQESAFNLCFQHRQMMVATCTTAVQACLGSDYPAVRCVMP